MRLLFGCCLLGSSLFSRGSHTQGPWKVGFFSKKGLGFGEMPQPRICKQLRSPFGRYCCGNQWPRARRQV